MPKVGAKPVKLHNRQAGLTSKPKLDGQQLARPAVTQGKVDDIRCDGDVVELSSLVPDPNNARLHPERNLESIKESLRLYGQKEPLVVRSQNRMIAAGNGRRQAMLEMGWTHCAVTLQSMTDLEFTGFALADNRTAELAKWDFEVVTRLDALMQELGGSSMTGWTDEEVEVLRKELAPPNQFPEVGEDIETDHQCPKCGYRWSGGEVKK